MDLLHCTCSLKTEDHSMRLDAGAWFAPKLAG